MGIRGAYHADSTQPCYERTGTTTTSSRPIPKESTDPKEVVTDFKKGADLIESRQKIYKMTNEE